MLYHGEQEPINKPQRGFNVKPSCLEVLFCICGDQGTRLWKFVKLFLVQLKSLTNRDWVKPLVDAGEIVLHISSVADTPPLDSSLGVGQQAADQFIHISLMYFKPYRPVLRRLYWPGESMSAMGHLLLRASHEYFVLYQFCALVPEATTIQYVPLYGTRQNRAGCQAVELLIGCVGPGWGRRNY